MPAPSVAERLRAYVRDRVKPQGKHYTRGAAARLAEHLEAEGFSEDAAWIAAYADPNADPQRYANIDVALAMCDFFGVNLEQFREGGPSLSRPRSMVSTGGSDVPASAERARVQEITRLKTRITGYEARLRQVRDVAREIQRIAAVRRQGRKVAGNGA